MKRKESAANSGEFDLMTKFIDLFAGLGGTRIGFEQASRNLGYSPQCVFTSEIKEAAIDTYEHNFPESIISGDLTKISSDDIPDFDYLLGGFPCQPFSFAGKRRGINDERGRLFFEIERLLKDKKPRGFLLENVEGLYKFDNGSLIQEMVNRLESLGFKVTAQVLNAVNFGVPQIRRRVYIAGALDHKPNLDNFPTDQKPASSVLEEGLPVMDTPFTRKLLKGRKPTDLMGKAIKDKRGGAQNLHSWDIELKGSLSTEQKQLMSELLKKRRYKKWAEAKGIEWMDGMPLTYDEIHSFFPRKKLQRMLDDLTNKGYLKFEHPKKIDVIEGVRARVPNTEVPKGYNIVAGKLSFEISKVLDPEAPAPTLVAMDMERLAVADPKGGGVRRLTPTEGLGLSGFPKNYEIPNSVSFKDVCDLIGNTIIPPVVTAVSERVLQK